MAEEAIVPVTEKDLASSGLPSLMKMSPGLALYFNDAIYNRVKQIAGHMSKAEGVTPRHLLGKPEACFAVITNAITWNMNPQSVCQATWQTPGGQIGYEAKLIVAIMENSGALDGRVSFVYKGDWSKLRGKFKQEVSSKGNKYFVPNWAPADEKDLSIVVSCQIKGETTRREEEFWLEELWPRNSTLWATRPRQQATYAVSRAFSSIATPGLILGLPFDIDPGAIGDDTGMMDITPAKPQLNEFTRSPARDPAMGDWIVKLNSAEKLEEIGEIRIAGLKELPNNLHAAFEEAADNRAHQIEEAMKAAEDREYEIVQKWQANLDAATKITQVANVRAGGLKELPEREHTAWNEACDVKAKDITDKPAGKKAAPKAEPKSEVETSMARGLRLLAGLDNADEINELSVSIAEELPVSEQNEWDKAIKKRLAEVKAK